MPGSEAWGIEAWGVKAWDEAAWGSGAREYGSMEHGSTGFVWTTREMSCHGNACTVFVMPEMLRTRALAAARALQHGGGPGGGRQGRGGAVGGWVDV